MKRAANYWMAALQVHQHTEPLRTDRLGSSCGKYSWETDYTCESSTAPTCGVDGVAFPAAYLNSMRTCSERCTEFTCASTCTEGAACTCSSGSTGVVDTSGNLCEACTTEPEGDGLQYDFYVFVTIKDSAYCGGNTLAYATNCVRDQCDRPIFGHVNFCLSQVDLSGDKTDALVSTAVHELAHNLVFSSDLFRYFRNSDGTPKLPRDSEDDVEDEVEWWCSSSTDYEYPYSGGGRTYVDLSAAGLVNVFDERNIGSCPCPMNGVTRMDTSSGCVVTPSGYGWRTPRCVTKMITPKVLEKARDHFDCATLNGAELENQDTGLCSIVGSHWEQRIFMNELMAPVLIAGMPDPFLSVVTLALFEDSGWYQPDYSMADTLVKDLHWGYMRGCSFATEPCVQDGSTDFPDIWCTTDGDSSCSLDRSGVKQCSITTHDNVDPYIDGWEYFDSPSVGGVETADYCPTYLVTRTDRVCTDMANARTQYDRNYYHEVFGSNSRCFESSLRDSLLISYEATTQNCYQVECSGDNTEYTVKVAVSLDTTESSAELGVCSGEGQTLASSEFLGEVACVNPSLICGVLTRKHTQGFFTSATTVNPDEYTATTTWTAVTTSNTETGTSATSDDVNTELDLRTSSTTTTTITTTTVEYDGTVVGVISLVVGSVAVLQTDSGLSGLKFAIALMADVDADYIVITLNFQRKRRLDDARLLLETVDVSYTVLVPPGKSVVTVIRSIGDTNSTTAQNILQQAFIDAGAEVTVLSVEVQMPSDASTLTGSAGASQGRSSFVVLIFSAVTSSFAFREGGR
eukprot:CAMPEP_0194556320 /NCGR_PEP_ID=MMETSP0253-20130528/98683_1 /TAXON_ID=2966 /ORGANISM="Noctiluca scintillans" /LENGTH=798 /DNA_ID=CAMNT_0039403823 /DNA_START=380 /DNA_END=2779 /DNA_ORIENTATION=+